MFYELHRECHFSYISFITSALRFQITAEAPPYPLFLVPKSIHKVLQMGSPWYTSCLSRYQDMHDSDVSLVLYQVSNAANFFSFDINVAILHALQTWWRIKHDKSLLKSANRIGGKSTHWSTNRIKWQQPHSHTMHPLFTYCTSTLWHQRGLRMGATQRVD